jgi:hypothetical protein
MAGVEMAANVTACAGLLGRPGGPRRAEVRRAHRRGRPTVEAERLRRGVRRRVLETWWPTRLARNRMPGPMRVRWPPRWLARGASRARSLAHELTLRAERAQPAACELVLRAVRAQPVACGLVLRAARAQPVARGLVLRAARAQPVACGPALDVPRVRRPTRALATTL